MEDALRAPSHTQPSIAKIVAKRWEAEIEAAIDMAKQSRPVMWGQWKAPRYRRAKRRRQSPPGNISPHKKRELLWIRKGMLSVVDQTEMVSVRGKVPREFFKWLEEQAQANWSARRMLSKCFFEER